MTRCGLGHDSGTALTGGPGNLVRVGLAAWLFVTVIPLAGCAAAASPAVPPFVIEEPPCDPLSPTDRELPVPTYIVPPEDPRIGVQPPPRGPVSVPPCEQSCPPCGFSVRF